MQNNVLNLKDALKISSIINKYFPKTVEGMNVGEFSLNLFSEISVEDAETLISILLGEKPISDPSTAIKLCIDTLVENKIVILLETYRNLGF